MPEDRTFYESSKKETLDNSQLAEWLRQLEDRIRKLESQSQKVTGSKSGRTD
jgi:hypothetical protein